MEDASCQRLFEMHHAGETGFSPHYLTLYSLVLGLRAQSVFEFGAGLSTSVILAALGRTGGVLTSCDVRGKASLANVRLPREPAAWLFLMGDSARYAADIGRGVYDFVLHDGSHEAAVVRRDLLGIIPRIRRNGLLLVHDTEHPDNPYGLREAVNAALVGVAHEAVTLPYGYGLTVVRILQDFGHGEVPLAWRKGQPL